MRMRRKAGEEHPLPPPRPPLTAFGEFTLAERRLNADYTMVLLRAARQQPFDVASALSLRPVPEEATAVLIQH